MLFYITQAPRILRLFVIREDNPDISHIPAGGFQNTSGETKMFCDNIQGKGFR